MYSYEGGEEENIYTAFATPPARLHFEPPNLVRVADRSHCCHAHLLSEDMKLKWEPGFTPRGQSLSRVDRPLGLQA